MEPTYILFGVTTLFSVIGFLIAFILHGIKSEIKEVNVKLDGIEHDLHTRISTVERRQEDKIVDIDRRLARIETVCKFKHGEE